MTPFTPADGVDLVLLVAALAVFALVWCHR